mmetsp:Transcript_20142/g.21888  ORF Transcript_20142/g.21888 Transcript_20142/m.21888 type:complete len:96 (-) Transcript_20142:4-291(-)
MKCFSTFHKISNSSTKTSKEALISFIQMKSQYEKIFFIIPIQSNLVSVFLCLLCLILEINCLCYDITKNDEFFVLRDSGTGFACIDCSCTNNNQK